MQKTTAELDRLIDQKIAVNNSIQDLQKSYDLLCSNKIELMQEKMNQAAEAASQEYQEAINNFNELYGVTMADAAAEFERIMAKKKKELEEIKFQIQDQKAKSDAAIEALKREEEKRLQLDKYKIILSDADLLEIKRLKDIVPYFRNARPIYKAIWESYYRTPTTELISRIVGNSKKTGIYKITNLANGFSYIGQARDLSERVKEHVKAGCGIDTPNSKLYVALKEFGVENFSYEILEQCEPTQLNDREKYWIAFYRTQEVGYNMSSGGSRA